MAVDRARLRQIIRVGLPASLYFAINAFQMWRAQALWEAAALLIMAVVVLITALAMPGTLRGWQGFVFFASLLFGILAWLASIDPVVNGLGFLVIVITQAGALALARNGMLNIQPYERDPSA